MTSPWNNENKYTTFDVISWYIEKRCNTLWCHANFCKWFPQRKGLPTFFVDSIKNCLS
jgi:hypothetical protein